MDRLYCLLFFLILSSYSFTQSLSLKDSLVRTSIVPIGLEEYGVETWDVMMKGFDLYFVISQEGAQRYIPLLENNGSHFTKIQIERSPRESSTQNPFLVFRISVERSEAWGPSGAGNKMESIVILDLQRRKRIIKFFSKYQHTGAEGGENFSAEWDCRYTTDFQISGDSLYIKGTNIMVATRNEADDETEKEFNTDSDPECKGDLESGLYLYDGNTFVKQAVKDE